MAKHLTITKVTVLAIVFCMMFTLLAGQVFGQGIDPAIKHLIHEINIIRIQDNTNDVWLLRDQVGKGKVIEVSAPSTKFSSSQLAVLQKFVETGATLWLPLGDAKDYIGEIFGLKAEYFAIPNGGWSFYNPSEMVLIPALEDYPLVTDVERVPVYSNWNRKDVAGRMCYGWYYLSPGDNGKGFDYVVLKSAEFKSNEGPIVGSRPMVVAKHCGEGLVIGMPARFTNKYDVERFMINLREFSAGFDVPGYRSTDSRNTNGRLRERSGQVSPSKEDISTLLSISRELEMEIELLSEVVHPKHIDKLREIKKSIDVIAKHYALESSN